MDETLYDELSFVRGALAAVARFVNRQWGVPQDEAEALLLARLELGRSHIIDAVLAHYGLRTTRNLRQCIAAYRGATPALGLYPDAERCLQRFRDHPLYLVTDGNKAVQAAKIRALGLDKRMKRCFATHQYGRAHAKPSPYCCLRICELEATTPGQVWYIGDNPAKDFVGLKPLGFRTVRLQRGQHREVGLGPQYEAEFTIGSLDELTLQLLSA